ncbi:glucosamine--fructose-6-phosphate aminotransferase [Thermosipho melanesiensis]|uniref:Glutamine--fructose-6-phosphate aminotransferase [isomerizing] n=2 Tax=Thermosipho melanesiensis TaxID=46541 RepID=A6LK87_THEM4|nr:glutamine--fructose-6-phosphate transaminase (isomerizing) [Thermosipho melanesiensis]ABR30338.1 glucosamine--fructose-6-phosphate aminotransferase, isomerizing [Thermosipho melanesiensis BI429]APT73504.1 glucosamine--fructose-6-phosphate aminotransferase [Thermosipho melanesiensis]OOC37454.1 glucosamine--fructose-6-phosphate aminotransferase [Thermosipho melanesiensis]OOC39659.1 glucosamine--fructose-6-phosphate aminotransferase [Thermosipho melanesiensis]OOC39688.1 glucosamine--fructose-6
MCGIVGMVGTEFKIDELVEDLQKLEYRGYDSAGVAFYDNGKISVEKSLGRIKNLKSKIPDKSTSVGIAHTRWATHGAPNDKNAHPHTDCSGKIAIVHNGIIENYAELKEELIKKGHKFKSDTDTEVIAHLIEELFRGDIYKAVLETVKQLKGAYAIVVMHSDFNDTLVAARKGSPLVLGKGTDKVILASDVTPILRYTKDVVFLEDGDVVFLRNGEYKITDINGNILLRKVHHVDWDETAAEKSGYKHFMLKEIMEEPEAIESALVGRITMEGPLLNELKEFNVENVEKIKLVACGTSYHAGLVFKYFLEKYVSVDVEVDVASEFRYRNIHIDKKTLVIAISQSGETADTLESVRLVKKDGAKIVSIANVVGSTITRESDVTIFMNAGPEIGVAATKTFVNQLVVLYILGMYILKSKNIWNEELEKDFQFLKKSPNVFRKILTTINLDEVSSYYKNYHHFMYIGRGINYPTALEGALKLKEISYINATAYPAGELKHGPIALLDPTFPVFAIVPKDKLFEKTKNNIEESRARKSRIIAVTNESNKELEGVADDIIYVPDSPDDMYPLTISPIIQLFAYQIADKRGYDPDKPRNLAKSVTVE